MIKTSFNLLLILMVFLSFSCSKEEPKPISTSTKQNHATWCVKSRGNRPEYGNFRYELWKDLNQMNGLLILLVHKRILILSKLELGKLRQ